MARALRGLPAGVLKRPSFRSRKEIVWADAPVRHFQYRRHEPCVRRALSIPIPARGFAANADLSCEFADGRFRFGKVFGKRHAVRFPPYGGNCQAEIPPCKNKIPRIL